MKFIAFIIFILFGPSLFGITYFVETTGSNSNLGTSASPFLTIQHGINQLIIGDSLVVQPGVYFEKVLIDDKIGSSSDLITIVANGTVVIDGTSSSPFSREGLITIRNSSYIRLKGFTIQNFTTSGGGPTPVGILVDGSGQGIQIRNNVIRNISNTTTCTGCAEGAHGIGVFGTTTSGLDNIDLISNEVYNNTLQSSEAFVINGNVDKFRVINNYVHDNNNIAFDFIGFEGECSACGDEDRARNGFVSNNIAENNSSIGNPWYPGTDGTAGGFYVDGGQYILFDRNTSTKNDLGFEFASEMPGKKTEDIIMSNNYIFDNIEVGVIMGGYNADNTQPGGGSAERIHVINNSFYQNKGWGSEIVFQHRVVNANIANNIFFGEASVGENYEVFGSNNTDNTWGHNIWWGIGTAGQSNLEGTLTIVNPEFINPSNGDLSISNSSAAKNIGLLQNNITGWPLDFWDANISPHGDLDNTANLRIEDAIDVGADEVNSSINSSITITFNCIEVNHNPFSSQIVLDGDFSNYEINILNADNQIVQDFSGVNSSLIIDLCELSDESHFLLIQHLANTLLGYQTIIK